MLCGVAIRSAGAGWLSRRSNAHKPHSRASACARCRRGQRRRWRGAGLLSAVEFAPPGRRLDPFDATDAVIPRVVAEINKRGVIARPMPQSDIIGFSPPLCLTHQEADVIVQATKDAVFAFDFPR